MIPDPTIAKRPRVLVVDDDPTVRVLARAALEDVGLEVVEAADRESALALAHDRPPDLVLLDVSLPDRDGFEICEELRRKPQFASVPIVMVAGSDDVDTVRRSYQLGANDFSAKPVPWLVLAQRVLSLLRASRTLDDLRESRRQLANAQRIALLGSWTYDAADDCVWISEEARRAVEGLPEGEIALVEMLARVHEADREAVRAALEHEAGTEDYFSFDFRVVSPNGSERHVRACAQGIADTSMLSGIVQDVTQQMRAEEQIRFLAYHDSLTFLGNRLSFKERLSQAIGRTNRRNHSVGVIFLDLDGFKRVNDLFGHEMGDRLLCEVGERLRGSVRGTDTVARGTGVAEDSFVARLGGDEFTIVLDEISNPGDLARVAERIAEVLPRPIVLGSNEFSVTGSMGLATWPQDGADLDTLLRKADTAMYQAKARGRGQYMFYSESMNASTRRRVELESKLRRAIDDFQLEVHFQPVARASDGEVIGAEALARCSRPGRARSDPTCSSRLPKTWA